MNVSSRHVVILIRQATLLALLCASVRGQGPEAGSEGQTWLRMTISDGRLSDLRWPDFSDYRQHVLKFYRSSGDSLWWVKGMEPTRQARETIALLSAAG